jgi:hypothetical protein
MPSGHATLGLVHAAPHDAVHCQEASGDTIGQLISQGTIRGTAAAGNRDHPAASILQLRSRQIDHRTTVYKVGDQEGD